MDIGKQQRIIQVEPEPLRVPEPVIEPDPSPPATEPIEVPDAQPVPARP